MKDSKRNFDFEKKNDFLIFFSFLGVWQALSLGVGLSVYNSVFWIFGLIYNPFRLENYFGSIQFGLEFSSVSGCEFRVAKRFRLLIRFWLINRVKLILAKNNQIK